MNVKLYQTLFSPEQYARLDPNCIPCNNLKNENSEFREYPLICDLFKKNRTYDGYWGLLSLKFEQKTGIKPSTFKQMIIENPGYDVYHYNPYKNHIKSFNNTFDQAEFEGHHVGMCNYINKLMSTLGYKNFDIFKIKFKPEHFSYCSYYVGNQYFWEKWMAFSSVCIDMSKKDQNLNYPFETTVFPYPWQNGEAFLNFPYVVERFNSLFFHLYDQQIKIKAF